MAKRRIPLLLQEFHPSRLLPSLIMGLVSGVVGVTICISFAALIFSGSLSNYVAAGIGIALFSSIVIRAVISLMSSFPGIIADVDERSSVILALVAASISKNMPTATPEETFFTVVLAIALTSLLTGAFLLVLGLLKVGEMIRFIPYPVLGGFMAGTGWLLAYGSIQVMTDIPLSFAQLPILFQADVLIRWLPGLIFAVLLLVTLRRYTHLFILPASLLAAIGLFYVLLWLTNTSLAEASTQNWLLGPFPEGQLWQPLSFSALAQVNWSVIFDHIGSMTTIMLISAASILLIASGFELTTEQDIDLNRELQVAGIANLVSGFGGGMVGYHVLSDSVLAYKMGGRSRLVGLVAAGVCIVGLVLGSSIFSFFPKPLLGGLLLFLGLDFLVEWTYDAWFKLSKADYLIVLLILAVIGAVGFLEGVTVGLFAAVVLFVINYSQISVTRHVLSGASYQSHVARPIHQSQLLRKEGDQIYILELQCFLFFGTANKLVNQIRQRLNDSHLPPLRFVVLDFRLVNGLDSSAVLSFIKMKQIAHKQQLSLVFTNLRPTVERQLQQRNCLQTQDSFCRVFPDLDRGIEWCEEQILEVISWRRRRSLPIAMQLEQFFPNGEHVSTFVHYLEQLHMPVGEFLFRQGSNPESLYIIESGQVSTLLEIDGGQTIRLQTLRAGTVVGEIAFYSKSPHTTSAITEQPSNLYRLLVSDLQRMQQESPDAAAAFQEFVICLLADRLALAYQEIENLLS